MTAQPAQQMTDRPHISWVDGRWGKCHFFTNDLYIGQSLRHYGEYNPDETEYVVAMAEKFCRGDKPRVLDIGANIGVISQALEASGFLVESFEPLPEVHQLLAMNMRGKTHNVALAERAGFAEMPQLEYGEARNFGGFSLGTRSSLRGAVKVEVKKLDDFNFSDVGLMKIDVEGFEERVLRGAVDTIARCRPALYIEDDRKDKSESLHAFVRELGYDIQLHAPPLFRPENHFGNKENVWGQKLASFNIVCLPK